MGYKEIEISLSVYHSESELKKLIANQTHIKHFTYEILRKSLDARKKSNLKWLYRLGIVSDEIKEGTKPQEPILTPIYRKRKSHILITGSGPAGLFSALFLLQSGFRVTIIERGSEVDKRKKAISLFEAGSHFDPHNNYAFGEGGAGTFSDGKLTSRTKGINRERNYIYNELIAAGAPEEIRYMTHPHLGTDNLLTITKNIRNKLQHSGCDILYDTLLTDIQVKDNRISHVTTSGGKIEPDVLLIASGLSSFETYRMMIRNGIRFRVKNFAIGFRAEHLQEIINQAQWGKKSVPGLKAAEYRLTHQTEDGIPVYSFCMCPGGTIVPATAYSHTNIVNGMSYYKRDGNWANAAIVAGINLEKSAGHSVEALEALHWLEQLETAFYDHTGSYYAPASTIRDFISNTNSGSLPPSSYPLKLVQSDFRELMPGAVLKPLIQGMQKFCRTIKGFDTGIIAGLESKTSSPIQAERHTERLFSTYENVYIAGEGSGWAGGIISSAADGLKISRLIAELTA